MLGFFKRYKLHRAHKSVHHYPFSFMTVCEHLAPMSSGTFDLADQSLENASDWLYQQHDQGSAANLGHFSHPQIESGDFQEALSLSLSRHSIPVVLSNCTEAILSMLPVVVCDNDEIGIINIGHRVSLKPTLDPRLGSAFHFALSRYPNVRMFFAGASEQDTKQEAWDYAEDQGCDWVTDREFTFRYRNHLKQQVGNYLDHCDQIVISIDLASLLTKNSLDGTPALDIQMVLRTIRLCLVSGKVKAVQLVGDKDRLVYSKQTKAILQELYQMAPLIDHAA
ncbi:arginase [Vibrio sp. 10N.222.52.B12]|uniref:arginase n=1 Tax=Vibrio sp. 10N.222.52.B12 TaxID=1880840 RepID=UPI000C83A55B|nr:arginase [Vibrio sp. 10N.222.52.B12]PMO51856.1 arginase [Vibrio sp. 10N.222.52.B12]